MPCVSAASFFSRSSRRGCLRVVPSAPRPPIVRRTRRPVPLPPAASPPATPPSAPAAPPRPKPRLRPRPAGPVKLSFRRWAVICFKDAQDAGLGDLVAVELSKENGLELVDRADLERGDEGAAIGGRFRGGGCGRAVEDGTTAEGRRLVAPFHRQRAEGPCAEDRRQRVPLRRAAADRVLALTAAHVRRSRASPRRSPRSAGSSPVESARWSPCRRFCRRTSCTITTTCRRSTRGCWKPASRSCPTSR